MTSIGTTIPKFVYIATGNGTMGPRTLVINADSLEQALDFADKAYPDSNWGIVIRDDYNYGVVYDSEQGQ